MVLYIFLFSYIRLNSSEIGVIEDRLNDTVAGVFYNDRNFIWQGSLPWLYSVFKVPAVQSSVCNLSFTIPSLHGLNNDLYVIKVPVKASYRIQSDRFTQHQLFRDSSSGLKKYVELQISVAIARNLDFYCSPAYNPQALIANRETLVKGCKEPLALELKSDGIELISLEQAGSLVIPDQRMYDEGLTFLAEMRRLDIDENKELKRKKFSLERKKLEDAQLYTKLKELSIIIKRNPDVLKYIYIDKMSSSVKVILPSDSAGIPKIFDDVMPSDPAPKKEIDNLR